MIEEFGSPLDKEIEPMVLALRACGVETFESCQGGDGHAYTEPTVRFHGDRSEGFRALAVAIRAGLPVFSLRRIWPILDGEPTGPWWEMTFVLAEGVPVRGSSTGERRETSAASSAISGSH